MTGDVANAVMDYLGTIPHGAWLTSRQIAERVGLFIGMSPRNKACAMTAVLKRLHANGHVEMDRSEAPAIWRKRKPEAAPSIAWYKEGVSVEDMIEHLSGAKRK